MAFAASASVGYTINSEISKASQFKAWERNLKTNSTLRILSSVLLATLCLLFSTPASVSLGQTEDSVEKIKSEQEQLAERYKQLEAKLFSLSQFEEKSNPARAKLLQKAFLQSQEQLTNVQLSRAGKLINDGKYKDAESMQGEALSNLTEMLKLLQAEDRGQQVRDDIDRYKEYLKEIGRLQRIQKGIRGQNEAGLDEQRLKKSEQSAAERTADLADRIKADSDAESDGDADPDSDENDSGDSEGEPSEGEPSEGQPSEGEPSEGEENHQRENHQKGQPSEGEPSEGEPSEGEPSEGEPSEGEQPSEGEPSEGQPSEGEPSEGQPSEDSPSQEPDSVQDKIRKAQERMEDAAEALDEARRDDANKDMEAAERELAEAKKELEEILRQLREEEVDSNLKQLEERFRGMLEQQTRVNEATDKLATTPTEARTTEFEISANRLAGDQNEIVTAAGRALLLLKEDGTSIAFPVTVEEMQQDMMQVSARLSAAKVNEITQEIEADIVETLNELIEALIKAQQENEDSEQDPQDQEGGEGSPGESPLVDQIAELKMLRSLQKRIYKRHQRYAKYLDDPDDPVGVSQEPDVVAALDRLAERQAQLTDIARQLVNEQNE